jgi:hypothetical protein
VSVPRVSIRRVLAGGLAAGLVCNVSGMLLALLVLHDEARAVFARLASPPSPWRLFAQHLAMRFALGLLLAWLVAALRPRFGSAARAALAAGVFIFLAAYLLPVLMLQEVQVYSSRAAALSLLWSVGEVAAMGLVAASLVRDAPTGAAEL